MKIFKDSLTISNKLTFLTASIYTAFILIIFVIIFSFAMIKQEITTVTRQDMGKAISNSRAARDFSKLFSDIGFLSHTFYGKSTFLKTEGTRLTRIIDTMQEGMTDPELKEILFKLNCNFSTLLDHCTSVNKVLDDIRFIDNRTHALLTSLEDLIAEIIILHTLEGENTDFAKQLLTLVIGYRESLLQIRKQFVELGPEHYLNFMGGNERSPVVTGVNDLILSLQTITASTPNVVRHGIKITRNVEQYRESVLGYYGTMNKLRLCMTDLDQVGTLFASAMENIEHKIVKAAKDTERSIERIIFTAGFAVVALAALVILLLGFATRNIVRSAITKPMKQILSHIYSFKNANLERRIDLAREDEWAIIEKGLNDMAEQLSKTYMALDQNEKFVTTIIENIPHMIFVKDAADLKFVRFNKAGENLLGYPRDTLIGKNDYDFFPKAEADFFTAKDREVINKGLLVDIPEESIQTRHNTRKTLHTKKIPIMDEYGQAKYLLGISEDITQKKVLEEQLRQARKMESIGTLSGGIAHDFNNILYMILGNTELAMEEIPKTGLVYEHLKDVKAASLRASAIVKQLLSFSRKTDHEMKPVEVTSVIKEALNFLRSTIPAHIDIQKHLPDTHLTICADPTQIHQVLMNLSINAIQGMEETGGILEVFVEKTTLGQQELHNYPDLHPDDYLKIIVKDNGPGIEPEIIDRIFDPYFTTKEIGKGSGMGLAVVHGIVKNHGGAITVDSRPGDGTTFTLLFPLISNPSMIESKTADEIIQGTEKILFIDDEKSIVSMIRKRLRKLGYRVETETNPVAALTLFKKTFHEFDLVITDMAMPQMTGAVLSEKIKEIRQDIPIIICTGHSPLMDKEKAEKMGIDAFIMKPIEAADIAGTIRRVLDGRKHPPRG